jgi:hypothetical protein
VTGHGSADLAPGGISASGSSGIKTWHPTPTTQSVITACPVNAITDELPDKSIISKRRSLCRANTRCVCVTCGFADRVRRLVGTG